MFSIDLQILSWSTDSSLIKKSILIYRFFVDLQIDPSLIDRSFLHLQILLWSTDPSLIYWSFLDIQILPWYTDPSLIKKSFLIYRFFLDLHKLPWYFFYLQTFPQWTSLSWSPFNILNSLKKHKLTDIDKNYSTIIVTHLQGGWKQCSYTSKQYLSYLLQ